MLADLISKVCSAASEWRSKLSPEAEGVLWAAQRAVRKHLKVQLDGLCCKSLTLAQVLQLTGACHAVRSWPDMLSPQMAGVLQAVQRAAGESLDAPEMSLFQPLVECLSPDALLAIGELH